ncbi:hypothetical protein GT354_22930 [Streptomyces sp. SID3343]|nr:hypothetical protein [Streptomyces sp. SID3343]
MTLKDVPAESYAGMRGDWRLGDGWVDDAGRSVSNARMREMTTAAPTDLDAYVAYLREHGLHWWVRYQPADRFRYFQLVEAGLYAGLALVLLAVTLERLQRSAA